MKSLLAFAKDSAKKAFKKLREQEYFFSKDLDKNINITRVFFEHVIYDKKKKRTAYEIMERILILPFLEEIISTGKIQKTREYKGTHFFRVSKVYKKYTLTVIIFQDTITKEYILLSCFKNF